MSKSKRSLILSLCGSLLLLSVFYLLHTTAGDGSAAITEPDTRLFLQYARNIAQGEPYIFTRGDPASTGSTTHLYPFLLSIPYLLGAKGDAFVTACYWMNGCFLLATLAMVWLITKKLNARALPLAMALSVLSGHTLSAFTGMTDMGFFSLLAMALLASILYNRFYSTLFLCFLCSISRPEGFIFSIAFGICAITGFFWNRKNDAAPGTPHQLGRFLAFALCGFLTFMAILLLNRFLTGHFQFMSVANKGYLKIYPFAGAIEAILFDVLSIIKGVFWGLPDSPRQFYQFPLLAGALGIAGIMLHPRVDKQMRLCECWTALSVGAVLIIIASGQFQGVSNDRYLGWVFLIWIIYISLGIVELGDRIKSRGFVTICASLLIAYQLVSVTYIAVQRYAKAVACERENTFAKTVAQSYPTSISFGCATGGSLGYYFSEHTFYNLPGITSPAFFEPDNQQQISSILELMKHEKELRFDKWFNYMTFVVQNEWAKPFVGEQEMIDVDAAILSPYSYAVYNAIWDTLDGGELPVQVADRLSKFKLIDRLDIGYLKDERSHNYSYTHRKKNEQIPIATRTDVLNGSDYTEVCRIVLGSESFTIDGAESGKPLMIVLRSAKTASGKIYFGSKMMPINHLEMAESLNLTGKINGHSFVIPPVEIRDKGFTETIIEVPGHLVKSGSQTITIAGDHISCAYWFYQ